MINYHLYENGSIGMCNALMSVENALIIALLKKTEVNFIHSGKIFNSEKGFNIFDLYDFDYHIYHNKENKLPKLTFDLHNAVIYKDSYPNHSFINGRSNMINLNNIGDFETMNSNTLGFYSYLFCLSNNERNIVLNFIKKFIRPKQKYIDIAKQIISSIGEYNCIHVRRGDYLNIPNSNNNKVASKDFIGVMKGNFTDRNVLVVSDEIDRSYFEYLRNEYILKFIQDYLPSYLDSSEKGLVSMIVASYSKGFIGTLKSTFTAIIQRYRKFNGFKEDFRYLYSQHKDLKLENGRMLNKDGLYSWNRVIMPNELMNSAFWIREWDECN